MCALLVHYSKTKCRRLARVHSVHMIPTDRERERGSPFECNVCVQRIHKVTWVIHSYHCGSPSFIIALCTTPLWFNVHEETLSYTTHSCGRQKDSSVLLNMYRKFIKMKKMCESDHFHVYFPFQRNPNGMKIWQFQIRIANDFATKIWWFSCLGMGLYFFQ